MAPLPPPEEILRRAEAAMTANGRTPDQVAEFRELLLADDGPEECPSCGCTFEDGFRQARPGERLTYYCTVCGIEGPPRALEVVRDVYDLLRLDAPLRTP